MADEIVLTVNRRQYTVQAAPGTPLLYVLRNELGLNGPQFGCGSESCGACMVLLGAHARQSCRIPVADVINTPITTLEGLSDGEMLHPIQRAFLDEQAAQCGYCTNGMLIAGAALLQRNAQPSDAQIRAALDGNLCRCGAHARVLRAVKRAAELLAEE